MATYQPYKDEEPSVKKVRFSDPKDSFSHGNIYGNSVSQYINGKGGYDNYFADSMYPIRPPEMKLERLIAIPATSPKLGSPFLRAYPPSLNAYGISQDAFLEFLDHLNRAAVASPPVQVLGLAGNIVGMVPLHTAQIVGGAVNAAATITTVAMSKGRVEMLLRRANSDIFTPRGLRASVAKLEAVAQLSNMPILDASGRLDKESSVLVPLEVGDDCQSLDAQHRRISALSPWIAHLEVHSLPPVNPPSNFFSKTHTSVSERQRKKEEKKIKKDRVKMHEDWLDDSQKARDKYDEELERLQRKETKLRRHGDSRRATRDLDKIHKEREKIEREYEKEMTKVEKDRKKDDKEDKMMRKILFLTIQQI